MIAEYRLHLKYPDGKMAPVWMRIGRPVELPTGNWECWAVLDGRLRGPTHGGIPVVSMAETSWQALAFAWRFLYQLVRVEVRHAGAVLYSQSGKYPIHFDELFPFLRDSDSPPPE